MDDLGINHSICPCCGGKRDYPTEPGVWRFLCDPALTEWRQRKYGEKPYWQIAKIIRCTKEDAKKWRGAEEGCLLIFIDGDKEPCHWPNNCRWEKVVDTDAKAQ